MARPRKCRKICALPENRCFGPISENGEGKRALAEEVSENQSEARIQTEEKESVQDQTAEEGLVMGLDEYETIRLIDLLGCTQEECAEQMGVARTTVQAVYNNARYKLAMSLVKGKRLLIDGGDYMLCTEADNCCKKNCSSRTGCQCMCGKTQGNCKKELLPSR